MDEKKKNKQTKQQHEQKQNKTENSVNNSFIETNISSIDILQPREEKNECIRLIAK